MIIKETCSCGARFYMEAEGGAPEQAMVRLDQWFTRHKENCRDGWELGEWKKKTITAEPQMIPGE